MSSSSLPVPPRPSRPVPSRLNHEVFIRPAPSLSRSVPPAPSRRLLIHSSVLRRILLNAVRVRRRYRWTPAAPDRIKSRAATPPMKPPPLSAPHPRQALPQHSAFHPQAHQHQAPKKGFQEGVQPPQHQTSPQPHLQAPKKGVQEGVQPPRAQHLRNHHQQARAPGGARGCGAGAFSVAGRLPEHQTRPRMAPPPQAQRRAAAMIGHESMR